MAGKFVQGNWLLPNNVNANKQSNYSIYFNGTNQTIATSYYWPTGNTAKSISLWFYKNSGSSEATLIGGGQNSNGKYFGVSSFTSNNRFKFDIKPSIPFSDNSAAFDQWQHIVVTAEPSGSDTILKGYVDGVLDSVFPQTITGGINTGSTAPVTIGENNVLNYNKFPNGKIDEVCIFERALSLAEVNSLYNSGTPGNPFDLSGDPVAYYKLGETAIFQNTAYSGNIFQVPNHAQSQLGWQGLPQNAWDGGKGGGGQNLGTTHTISYWLNNNNHNNSSYNRAGWFGIHKSTNAGGVETSGNNNFQSQGIIYGRGGSSSADGNMPVAGNYITYRTGSNSSTNNMQFPLGSINLQDNQTYNIIFVRDGGSVKCFINGQELQNPVGSINASFELIYQIISNYTFYGIQRGWGGIMTNVAIWKSDRESEVDNIYNNGEPQSNYTTAPDIWYKFDDTTTSYPGQYKRAINSSSSLESYVKSYLQQPFFNGAGTSWNYIYSILDSDLNLGTSYSFSFWMGFRTDRENFYGYYNKQNVYYLGTNTSNTNVSGILEQDTSAQAPNTGSNVSSINFTLYDSNGNTATGLNLANSGNPSLNTAFDGQLHNYMFIKDGQTVSFYFDNQLVASSTMAGELSNTVLHNINGSDGGNAVARSNYTASAEWSFFANKVLSSSERATIYNSGDPGDISSTSPTIWYSYDNIDVINEKLLDKGSSSTNASILRRSGSNMNAGSSMGYIKYRDGVQAGNADLTSTDLGLHNPLYSQFSTWFPAGAAVDTNFTLPAYTKYSYSFWYKKTTSTTFSGDRTIIGNLKEGSGVNIDTRGVVMLKNENIQVVIGNGSVDYSNSLFDVSSLLLDQNWHHVVLTWINGQIQLFIDGSLENTYTDSNIITGVAAEATTKLGRLNTQYPKWLTDSLIDEFAIFDRQLSNTEIVNIYNNGKPTSLASHSPVQWWRLGDTGYATTTASNSTLTYPNEISGQPNGVTTASMQPSINADAPKVLAPGVSSGLVELSKKGETPNSTSNSISYNILKTDQSIYTPKYVSQYTVDNNYSMAFDGNDYISFPDISLSGEFTISFWIKPNAFNFAIIGDASSQNWLRIYNATRTDLDLANTQSQWESGATFTTGEWQHVVLRRDSNNLVTIFRNGIHYTNNAPTRTATFGPINRIGQKSNADYFNGLADEVTIFDKALTADQIKFDIYEASATANKSADFINNPNLPDPVAWYRMGD